MTVHITIPQPCLDNANPCQDKAVPVLSKEEKQQLKEKIIRCIADVDPANG